MKNRSLIALLTLTVGLLLWTHLAPDAAAKDQPCIVPLSWGPAIAMTQGVQAYMTLVAFQDEAGTVRIVRLDDDSCDDKHRDTIKRSAN